MVNLCLGTAQLGMNYGINNKVGKLEKKEVFRILDRAIESGIKRLDTAGAYGDPEMLLGEYFKSNPTKRDMVKIISKQSKNVADYERNDIEGIIRNELQKTLSNLGCDKLDGYLLHGYKEITNIDTIEILNQLKKEGLVDEIGVSLYEIEEAKIALASDEVDAIQMPFNVFDQRGKTLGIFEEAKKKNKTVFARSAFLQGLLMMDSDEVPIKLSGLVPYVEKLNMLLRKYSLEKKHAIVRFVLEQELIDYMVFGVETTNQLEEIVSENNEKALPMDFVNEVMCEFQNISEQLILPINW